jgi:ArsR family transcriptional regulator, zinc-responsive transcriptional repressor
MSELPVELLQRMAEVLKVLAHAHRLKIVEILKLEQEAPVHEIIARLGLPQATISQHLNQMRRVGLVKARRDGKEVWYSIADPSSLTILDCIQKKRGTDR